MTVFLITGVTGNLGAAALRSVLDRVPPRQIRVLVRSAQAAVRFVVESAVTAGVSHVVYTSGMGARHDPGHSAAEDALASMAVPNKTLWELRGPLWDFDDLADALTTTLARPVRHNEVEDAATGPFAVLFPLIRRGVFASESSDLDDMLGRKAAGIADVVNRMRVAAEPGYGG
jgi:uncharacterized protein YbjT (DUF2867 family)